MNGFDYFNPAWSENRNRANNCQKAIADTKKLHIDNSNR